MRDIVYESQRFSPDLVTGRYVRVEGSRKNGYVFRVFETATGTGRFAGKPGHGPTLREYLTDGAELPAELRTKCIESKMTEKWVAP